MSVHYRAVNWNRQKRLYDGAVAVGGLLFLGVFVTLSLRRPDATLETALIRGLGALGFTLLHVILCIGPLARLDRRFLPLLYNRRHLGVTMALVATGHAAFALLQYHSAGEVPAVVSLLQGAPGTRFPTAFPFEWLGLLALVILVLMAATSHDFWLSVLTPRAWKTLHMGVYLAYGLLLLHVALGVMQAEQHPAYTGVFLAGMVTVFGLHIAAGFREWKRDQPPPVEPDGWVHVCPVHRIEEGRAQGAIVAGERVAVFRHEGRLSAVSGVCRHQNGPLAEGRIVDGCITCPWHGYQYLPATGVSPPPFDDRIPTYNLRVQDGQVYVSVTPNPAGTHVDPVAVT